MLAVTGATGFIGRHLMRALEQSSDRVRILVRRRPDSLPWPANVEVVVGSISDAASLRSLVERDCTVVSLAFSHAAVGSEAVAEAALLADVCASARIRRFVQCSTVSVYGRVSEDWVTEDTKCNPLCEYGRTKLAIEQQLLKRAKGKFELAILRPSEVFGRGGQGLVKPIHDLIGGNRQINLLRSILFARRSTHLVPVETVAAAIGFLCLTDSAITAETFNISDDDNPLNNFRDVQRILMEELHVAPHVFPPPAFPRQFLEALLWARGRPNLRSRATYRCEKLMEWGFVKPVTFEAALRRFAAQYRVSAEIEGAA